MKRYLKVLCLLSFVAFAACKKDDDTSIAPPRDYAVQYGTEKPMIEDYLKTHYITVDADMNVAIFDLPDDGSQTSIWDQQEYPLQHKMVTYSGVEYTVYYLSFFEGVGEAPSRYDNVLVSYRGWLLDGSQFDYLPYPQNFSSLYGTIQGWQEIIPLFKEGVFDSTPSPDPVQFTDYGAGVMFLPSALGYYDLTRVGIPSYSPLVFSFKLFDMETADDDNDGLPNKYETEPGILELIDYDTDGDGTPNYQDVDDDNDGYSTRDEITIPGTNPEEVYDFDAIPTCTTGKKRHIDPSCNQDF